MERFKQALDRIAENIKCEDQFLQKDQREHAKFSICLFILIGVFNIFNFLILIVQQALHEHRKWIVLFLWNFQFILAPSFHVTLLKEIKKMNFIYLGILMFGNYWIMQFQCFNFVILQMFFFPSISFVLTNNYKMLIVTLSIVQAIILKTKCFELSQSSLFSQNVVTSSCQERIKSDYFLFLLLQIFCNAILGYTQKQKEVLKTQIQEEKKQSQNQSSKYNKMKKRLAQYKYSRNGLKGQMKSQKDKILQLQEKVFTQENEKNNKNQFIAAMIHELRNPLNSVLGSLDIISNRIKELPLDKIALIKNAQDSGEVLLGMISNILDASKIESGKFDLNIEPTEIRKFIFKIVQVNKANALRKSLKFSMRTDALVPR